MEGLRLETRISIWQRQQNNVADDQSVNVKKIKGKEGCKEEEAEQHWKHNDNKDKVAQRIFF